MVKVRKGNVVLHVPEAEVQRYADNGFDIYENGVVVKSATPNDINVLKKLYVEHINEIETLKLQINELKAEIGQLKTNQNNTKKPAKKTQDK